MGRALPLGRLSSRSNETFGPLSSTRNVAVGRQSSNNHVLVDLCHSSSATAGLHSSGNATAGRLSSNNAAASRCSSNNNALVGVRLSPSASLLARVTAKRVALRPK